jgi:hypothetical protein
MCVIGISDSKASIVYTIEQPGSKSVIFDESTWIKIVFPSANFISMAESISGSEVLATGDYALLGVSTVDFLPTCPDAHGNFACDEVIVHYGTGGANFYYFPTDAFGSLGEHREFFGAISALDVSVPEPAGLALLGLGVAAVFLSRLRLNRAVALLRSLSIMTTDGRLLPTVGRSATAADRDYGCTVYFR